MTTQPDEPAPEKPTVDYLTYENADFHKQPAPPGYEWFILPTTSLTRGFGDLFGGSGDSSLTLVCQRCGASVVLVTLHDRKCPPE